MTPSEQIAQHLDFAIAAAEHGKSCPTMLKKIKKEVVSALGERDGMGYRRDNPVPQPVKEKRQIGY